MRKFVYYGLLPIALLIDFVLQKVVFRQYYKEQARKREEAKVLLQELNERADLCGRFLQAVGRMWKANPPQGIVIFENGKQVDSPSFVR